MRLSYLSGPFFCSYLMQMQTPTIATNLYVYTHTYAYIDSFSLLFGHHCLLCIKRRQEKKNRNKKKRAKEDRQTTHLSNHRAAFFLSLTYKVDVGEYIEWVNRRHCCRILCSYALIYIYILDRPTLNPHIYLLEI
jgi:hypothetical protein